MAYCNLIFQTERDLKKIVKKQKPQTSFKVLKYLKEIFVINIS